MHGGDPFAQMAATLAGAAPPPPTPAEVTARRLGRAASILRKSGDPDALEVARGIEGWLARGGDLAKALGVKARRGRRRDLPAYDRRLRMRDVMLRELADQLRKPGDSQRAHLARVVACLRESPAATVIREVAGVDVPTSPTRLRAIIRTA